MTVTWSNSLGKIGFLGGLCGIQVVKSHLYIIFRYTLCELYKQNLSFQRLRNFRRFQVFVLKYRSNPKSPKRREIVNLVECKAILLQCVF